VSAQILSLIFAGVMVFLFALYYRQALAVSLIRRLLRPLPAGAADRAVRICLTFADGLHVLRNAWHILMAVVATLCVWGIALLGVWALMRAFPFEAVLSFRLALLVLVLIAAGLALPNAPGYVGTFHMAIVLGLLMGNPSADLDQAIAFAILYHLTQFLPAILLGWLFIWLDGLSFLPSRLKAAGSSSGQP
jgi:hypothetical protein